MAQVFDRSSNALARGSLVLTGLIVIALAVTLNSLQRSPWVTRQGQRAEQPVPFSHKHHVEGLGLQCQYCHTSVEKSSYAGIPPTKTCINCHSQIWTNATLLEPVRESWATGQSIPWIRVHDLPDYVYFNHEIHVNKGIGCASCHGRVDEMPIMYEENSLQMEWCLNCHRDPGKNMRPTSEIYNMAWAGPSSDKPVWCGNNGKTGVPTAQTVNCTTTEPKNPLLTMLQSGSGDQRSNAGSGAHISPHTLTGGDQTVSDMPAPGTLQIDLPVSYTKFTSQTYQGAYLTQQYHIRPPDNLVSCEVCHR